jgi:hypothetical protein
MLDSPVILLCSERSGSNLITRIFDAHQQVCAPGASHLFKVMSECACRYPRASQALRDAVLMLFETKVSEWKIDSWPREDRAEILARHETAGEMAAGLYAAEAKARGKRYVFIKENSAFKYLHVLTEVSRAPRFLFMVRDPRDMVLSWIKGPVMRGGVVRATERWLYDQSGYLEVVAQFSSDIGISFVRYEDLIAQPEEEVVRICSDLDVTFDPNMLQFHTKSASAIEDAKRSSMWSNLSAPIMQENSNKFLAGLDDDEIAYIEARTSALAVPLGYKSVREGLPTFGNFPSLEALHAYLAAREPHTKEAYSALPHTERNRFEAWSRLYADMKSLPVLAPARILGDAG